MRVGRPRLEVGAGSGEALGDVNGCEGATCGSGVMRGERSGRVACQITAKERSYPKIHNR